jgi:pimeloyl-ACP methyl ester carboxylesterase
MTRVQIDDEFELHVERFGPIEAPVVLLIRGTGADSSRWMPQVEAYQEQFNVIIFDNRGVGKSDTPPGMYTVAQMAEDTFAVLDALSVPACHVSGSSLGGAIALQMAVQCPERLLSLQLHSSWLGTRDYTAYSLGLLKKILELGGTDFYYEATLPLLLSPSFLSSDYQRLTDMLAKMRANGASYEGLMGQIAANLTYDLRSEANAVTVPTLITVGELDFLCPVASSQELHTVLPHSELVIFEGVGHLASMEAAAEFNAVTLKFMHTITAA